MPNKDAITAFHREAISDVADNLFVKKGFAETSMDDIAREANYSKATLYVYFNSKQQIYHYILLKAMRLLLDKLGAGVACSKDALEQYHAICREFWSYSEQHPSYYRWLSQTIATDEKSRTQDELLESIYETGEQLNGLIQEVIENGIRSGYFRDDLPSVVPGLLYGSMLFSAIELANNKAEYITVRTGMAKADFMQFAFNTMLRGLLKRGE